MTIKNIIKHKFTCVQFQIQQKKGKTDPGVIVIQSQKNTNTKMLDIQDPENKVPDLILNQCTFLVFRSNSSSSLPKSFPNSSHLKHLNVNLMNELQGVQTNPAAKPDCCLASCLLLHVRVSLCDGWEQCCALTQWGDYRL